MKRFVAEVFISLMLVATSADLLDLYFSGAWYDPNRFIEVSELAMLALFIVMSLSYFVWRIRQEMHNAL